MALVIKQILPSDSISDLLEKSNYNFNQILLNGGGPQGQRGVRGPQGLIGATGTRGTLWFTGIGDPTVYTFPLLVEYDKYLDNGGTVWEYDGSVWVNTGTSLKGAKGDAGINEWATGGAHGTNPNYEGEDYIYIPGSEDLWTLTGKDIRSLLVGGYPSGGAFGLTPIDPTYASNIGINAGVLFLHSYYSTPHIVFSLDSGTNDIVLMPKIYSIANDTLSIVNPINVNTVSSQLGIDVETNDTSINFKSARDIVIYTTGTPDTAQTGSLDTHIGNIDIQSMDNDASYVTPNRMLLSNSQYNSSVLYSHAKILMTSAAKIDPKYILLESGLDNGLDQFSQIWIGEPSTQDIFIKPYSNFRLETNSSKMLFTDLGSLGMGDSSSAVSAWLGYYNGIVNDKNRVIHLKDTVTNTVNGAYEFGLYIDKTFQNTSLGSPYKGGAFYNLTANRYGDMYFNLYGTKTILHRDSPTNMDEMGGHSVSIYSTGAGPLQTIRSFDSYIENTSGTVVNAYHIYLRAMQVTAGSITNKYGIYQAGSSELNYFSGKLMLGTSTVPADVNDKVIVGGRIRFETNAIVDTPADGTIAWTGTDFMAMRGGAWHTMTGSGISYVSVSPQSNNYLVACSGTSNALVGEANLLFDGSVLTVTGDETISGTLHVASHLYTTGSGVTGKTGFGAVSPTTRIEVNGDLSFTNSGVSADRFIKGVDAGTDLNGDNIKIIGGAGGGLGVADHTSGGSVYLEGGAGSNSKIHGKVYISSINPAHIYLHTSDNPVTAAVCVNTTDTVASLNIKDTMYLTPRTSDPSTTTPGVIYMHDDGAGRYRLMIYCSPTSLGTTLAWREIQTTT